MKTPTRSLRPLTRICQSAEMQLASPAVAVGVEGEGLAHVGAVRTVTVDVDLADRGHLLVDVELSPLLKSNFWETDCRWWPRRAGGRRCCRRSARRSRPRPGPRRLWAGRLVFWQNHWKIGRSGGDGGSPRDGAEILWGLVLAGAVEEWGARDRCCRRRPVAVTRQRTISFGAVGPSGMVAVKIASPAMASRRRRRPGHVDGDFSIRSRPGRQRTAPDLRKPWRDSGVTTMFSLSAGWAGVWETIRISGPGLAEPPRVRRARGRLLR